MFTEFLTACNSESHNWVAIIEWPWKITVWDVTVTLWERHPHRTYCEIRNSLLPAFHWLQLNEIRNASVVRGNFSQGLFPVSNPEKITKLIARSSDPKTKFIVRKFWLSVYRQRQKWCCPESNRVLAPPWSICSRLNRNWANPPLHYNIWWKIFKLNYLTLN
jgi:hypothetical protein